MAQTETHTDYLVTGMTCGHCVASVIEEVSLVPGVSRPTPADIRAAIDEAGYELAGSAGAESDA
jgi:copper chaperone